MSLTRHWLGNCPILMSKFDFIVTQAWMAILLLLLLLRPHSQKLRIRRVCVAPTKRVWECVSEQLFSQHHLLIYIHLHPTHRLAGATPPEFINICVTRSLWPVDHALWHSANLPQRLSSRKLPRLQCMPVGAACNYLYVCMRRMCWQTYIYIWTKTKYNSHLLLS